VTAEVSRCDQLADRLGEVLGARHPVAAVAVVTPSAARVASRGADLDADYEIASISKGFTGLLYADALARGEIRRESPLGEQLPIGDVPAARVRLNALATHRSGLPRLPKSMQPWRRTAAFLRHGTNPYREDLGQLLDHARGVKVGKPRARYSNFGFQLLGHAIAGAAGATYADLVRDRLVDPLGLEGCYVPATADQLRSTALIGRNRRGKPRQPWTGEALGPAGGIRASILDMARLTSALLDGSAPGVVALDPIASIGVRTRIGAAWLTTTFKERTITWHNGGSGGFRSWLGLDRLAHTGVVILSATSASVDRHVFALLAEHTRTADG
jgi:CubicO group peptidase (beta-lactamase class C family)